MLGCRGLQHRVEDAAFDVDRQQGIENGVNWCMDLLEHMWDRGYVSADPTLAAQERWTAHVTKMYAIMLMRKAKSWFTGYNSNVPGHEHGKVRYFVLPARAINVTAEIAF